MIAENKRLFEEFDLIHAKYGLEPEKWQEEFNKQGKVVMKTVRDYEDKLCRTSEKGGYGVFSGNLAEKFQNEVRKVFPQIDRVGIIVKKPILKPLSFGTASKPKEFSLKKINLH